MFRFFRDLAIIIIFLGLFGLDRSYVLEDSIEVQNKIKEITNGQILPESDFQSDGCTLWPQAILDISWEESCLEHDIKYWFGGPEEERLKADEKLRDDINKIMPGMGDIVYLGVKAGGTNLIPFPWHWGYGWDSSRTTSSEE